MINYQTKPKVSICLNPVLEAYCRFLFETPADLEYVVLTRRHDVGMHISSHVNVSELPMHRPFHDNQVTFILPITKDNHYALKYRFFYVSKWAEEKIQNFIESSFRQWIRVRFEEGYKLGYKQEEIIDAILRGLNVRNTSVSYDMIKKIDYRNRRKNEDKRFKMLLNSTRSAV